MRKAYFELCRFGESMLRSVLGRDAGRPLPRTLVRRLHLVDCAPQCFCQPLRHVVLQPRLSSFEGAQRRSRHSNLLRELRLRQSGQLPEVTQLPAVLIQADDRSDRNRQRLSHFEQRVDLRGSGTGLPREHSTHAYVGQSGEVGSTAFRLVALLDKGLPREAAQYASTHSRSSSFLMTHNCARIRSIQSPHGVDKYGDNSRV